MREIAVGVVGVGYLGRHHARLYAAMPAVRLVAVVDRDRERAAAVAAEFECEAYDDAEALLGKVEAASVAVPTVHHREVAERLLRGGADVLVEKPMAHTLDEADAINAAAAKADRLVMVGHTERFNPAAIALAGAVEAPRFFEIHRLAEFTARSTDIDVLLDLMVHDLDLLLYLDGTEPESFDAVGVAALTDKLDIANARIRMASGCVANITASRISVERVRRVRVFQPRTYLTCDAVKGRVERYTLVSGADGAPSIEHDLLGVGDGEPLGNEIAAFIDCVRTRARPPVDGDQGRRVLALAIDLRKAVDDSMVR
jgi:predicted dehydrogenase